METLADYLSMGVPNIWRIDPIRRSGHIFDSAGLHQIEEVFTVTSTPISLNLDHLFRKLDQKIAAHKAL